MKGLILLVCLGVHTFLFVVIGCVMTLSILVAVAIFYRVLCFVMKYILDNSDD